MTHAFFKALLFLGAGAVILSLHHEQNIWKMGNLKRYLPLTYACMLLGSLALAGFPLFSGFYSKELIIEAVGHSSRTGAFWAHKALLLSVFVTALYSFRLLFVVFHGPERMEASAREHLHEPSWVITVPLCLLALFSVCVGFLSVTPLLEGVFQYSIPVMAKHDPLVWLKEEFKSPLTYALQALQTPAFYLCVAGIISAWLGYVKFPQLPALFCQRLAWLHKLLLQHYGFDAFYISIIAPLARGIGWVLWQSSEQRLIDGAVVNGSAKTVGWIAKQLQCLQSGYLYHYAFVMVASIVAFMIFLTLGFS